MKWSTPKQHGHCSVTTHELLVNNLVRFRQGQYSVMWGKFCEFGWNNIIIILKKNNNLYKTSGQEQQSAGWKSFLYSSPPRPPSHAVFFALYIPSPDFLLCWCSHNYGHQRSMSNFLYMVLRGQPDYSVILVYAKYSRFVFLSILIANPFLSFCKN